MADADPISMDAVLAVDATAEADRRQAVAESRQLLDERLAEWCRARNLHLDTGSVVTAAPVLYQVGLDLDALIWVALVRFTVDVDGRQLQGLVRGPVDDPVFRVERGAQQAPGVGATTTSPPTGGLRRLVPRQRAAA
jgi:hypothetical protein